MTWNQQAPSVLFSWGRCSADKIHFFPVIVLYFCLIVSPLLLHPQEKVFSSSNSLYPVVTFCPITPLCSFPHVVNPNHLAWTSTQIKTHTHTTWITCCRHYVSQICATNRPICKPLIRMFLWLRCTRISSTLMKVGVRDRWTLKGNGMY